MSAVPPTSKYGVLFVRAGAAPSCYEEVRKSVEAQKGIGMYSVNSLAEASELIQQGWYGVAYLLLQSKSDLLAIVAFLNRHQKELKTAKSMRIGIFSKFDHSKIVTTLQAKGASDVIEFNSTAKTVLHKIQYHLKIVKPPEGANTGGDSKTKAKGTGSKAKARTKGGNIEMVPPVTVDCDYWILRSAAHARYTNNNWLIEMLGPGPATGSWDPPVDTPKDTVPVRWVWNPRDAEGPFSTPHGNWVFKGRRPEFHWQSNRWRFVGPSAALAYVEDGKITAFRFMSPSGGIAQIAENSPQAEELLPRIMETVLKSYRFSKEGTPTAPPTVDWDVPLEDEEIGNDLDLLDEDLDLGLAPGFTAEAPHPPIETWATGEDALKPFELRPTWRGLPIEILDQTENSITFDAPQGNEKVGHPLSLDVDAVNMNLGSPLSVRGVIASKAPHEIAGREIIVLQLDVASLRLFHGMQQSIEKRQEDIMRFFKAAKGTL